MSNEKPVELTEAEREADLLLEVGHPSRPDRLELMHQHIERIKAAARREALLEAAQWFAHEDIDAFGTSRESAQTYTVLVLADEAQRPGGPRFALAEPERDEEGGR